MGCRLDAVSDRQNVLDEKLSKLLARFTQFVDNCDINFLGLSGGGGRMSREYKLAS